MPAAITSLAPHPALDSMENNNREKQQTAMKTVGGKKRKLTITTEHDDDDDDKKRNWSDLPYDILELIKKGLFFIDQVNFRVVCKSWSCIRRVEPLQQIPWLFVFDNMDSYLFRNKYSNIKTKEKNIVDSCKLVNSKNKKTYTIDADVIKAKLNIIDFDDVRVHESKYGWLLISKVNPNHTALFLYSPFFSEGYNLIELPVLMNCSICCATFTSNPLEEDCKIFTLSSNFRDNTFFWETNSDNTIRINTYRCGQGSWSSQDLECEFKHRDTSHWIYSEGSLYYRTSNGTMGKFNLALGEWTVLPRLPPSIYHQHYKVTSSDGELFVIVECYVKKRQNRWSHESRIYRLDLSSMIWEELDSIGDRVLFFGDGYNSVVDSSVLKLNGERKDISDMIYYCKTNELGYCSVHDFTLKLGENEKPPGKQNCSRHYGSIATKHCKKMLIDPPPR